MRSPLPKGRGLCDAVRILGRGSEGELHGRDHLGFAVLVQLHRAGDGLTVVAVRAGVTVAKEYHSPFTLARLPWLLPWTQVGSSVYSMATVSGLRTYLPLIVSERSLLESQISGWVSGGTRLSMVSPLGA